MKYKISHSTKELSGVVDLPFSKSISNRVLIIRALCNEKFNIKNLAESDDTLALLSALELKSKSINVGAAGTTSRFLTAFLSITQGEWELSGTERLHQRPIGELVNALKSLGAEIKYLENEGC